MTRAAILVQVKHAQALANAGDCEGARDALDRAWSGLNQYAQTLARRGASPQWAVALHKTISTAVVRIGRRCPELLGPSGQSAGRNPDLMTPSGQVRARNPDLLAPSFHGASIESSVVTTLTTLGIAGAVFGLGYGFYMMYKGNG